VDKAQGIPTGIMEGTLRRHDAIDDRKCFAVPTFRLDTGYWKERIQGPAFVVHMLSMNDESSTGRDLTSEAFYWWP